MTFGLREQAHVYLSAISREKREGSTQVCWTAVPGVRLV